MKPSIQLQALPDFPLVEPGDDLASLVRESLDKANIQLVDGDCLVIAQKVVSKSEGRYATLTNVQPSDEAHELAQRVKKDPRLVQLILDESVEVVRHKPGVLIVEHRLGYVHANAGIDKSNIESDDSNPRVLLLPEAPDQSAAALRKALMQDANINELGVVISDSAGRAWRNGVAGFAIGTAGFEALVDEVGKKDLFGRELVVTQIAVADELAAAASLIMGQADNAAPVVLVRGFQFTPSNAGSSSLIRAKDEDLFR